jgi:hypothetical protein
MLIACPFQQDSNGSSSFIHVSHRHTKDAVSACVLAPIPNALASAVQQGQDCLVPPRMRSVNEPGGQNGINLSREVPWDTPAQFSSPPTPWHITTRHPMSVL